MKLALALLLISGTAAAAPSPSRVVTEHFASKALGVDKQVVVYLPAGYDSQPKTRWPVFYYLHGLGGNETNWTKHGHLDQAADKLGLAAIVVMPDGDDDFYVNSPAPIDYDQCMKDGSGLFLPERQPHDTTCVRQRNYGTYIASDLISWVDGKYRTIAKQEGRGIAGLSMGGFGAIDHALLDGKFAAAASHSGALELRFIGPRPYDATKPAQLLADPAKLAARGGKLDPWIAQIFGPKIEGWKQHDLVELITARPAAFKGVALYFDCGTEDDYHLQDNLAYVHDQLTAHKIAHDYYVGPGKHDFAFWTARLPFSLGFLRDHVAKPQ